MAAFLDTLKGNDVAIQIVVGQGRMLTTRGPIATEAGDAMIAVGDPTILDFDVLPNPRMIRLLGKRAGVTDLSITTSENQVYNFEVHVGYDLELLRAQLRQVFPDAQIRFGQIREHLVVEGQARSPAQVTQILQSIEAYLASVQVPHAVGGSQPTAASSNVPPRQPANSPEGDNSYEGGVAASEEGPRPDTSGAFAAPQIINLLRVPGVQQVMLQVRIAELNRTALRRVGADILAIDSSSGNIVGTNIGGGIIEELGLTGAIGSSTTAFGIFPSGDWQILLNILRRNSVLNILAEPNLVTLNGHHASFLAGGQFPVPVPQGGTSNNVTIEFKDFGVHLDFVPYIQDDGVIRLQVDLEVSTIDFSIGTIIVEGGTPVPGLNTRKANTTVEIRQGQTLAIAGLLNVELDALTSRIPGLGDLPYIGPFFSNTSHERVEKELIVLVTPLLVAPMDSCEVGPLPGSEIKDPNDKEFYLLNRIEGRTGRHHRSTTSWDNPLGLVEFLELQSRCTCGPVGFSE
ncbi:MAG: pilus assembly protein N-terminal domain-containing protein [Planctomycetes bacterium]|nr:pilus assembly protein N-terminal domain-containing protein [Planctomycetota bacterium]